MTWTMTPKRLLQNKPPLNHSTWETEAGGSLHLRLAVYIAKSDQRGLAEREPVSRRTNNPPMKPQTTLQRSQICES